MCTCAPLSRKAWSIALSSYVSDMTTHAKAPPLPLCPTHHPIAPPQEQYIFIHDALVEYTFAGARLLTPDQLTATLKAAKPKDKKSKLTGFEEEFDVSQFFFLHFIKQCLSLCCSVSARCR